MKKRNRASARFSTKNIKRTIVGCLGIAFLLLVFLFAPHRKFHSLEEINLYSVLINNPVKGVVQIITAIALVPVANAARKIINEGKQ